MQRSAKVKELFTASHIDWRHLSSVRITRWLTSFSFQREFQHIQLFKTSTSLGCLSSKCSHQEHCLRIMGISRSNLHKRRKTGGRRAIHRKKRKHELGRPAAHTKVRFFHVHNLYLVPLFGTKYHCLILSTTLILSTILILP